MPLVIHFLLPVTIHSPPSRVALHVRPASNAFQNHHPQVTHAREGSSLDDTRAAPATSLPAPGSEIASAQKLRPISTSFRYLSWAASAVLGVHVDCSAEGNCDWHLC